MRTETKVGLFLMVATAAILASILFLGKIHLFQRTHTYFMDFDNVDALPPKSAVKISGVEVGKVERLRLVDGKARVQIEMNHDIVLYSNATGRIGSTGIIGTRFVELNPGTPDQPELPEKSVIKGKSSASMEDMFNKISSLFEEDPVNGSAVNNLKITLSNIRRISDSLEAALGNREKELTEIVMNIRDISQSAKVFMAHLEEISTERKEDVKIALGKFKDISVKLDDLLGKIQRGEGTIGALVSDGRVATDVKEAVASIKSTAASADEMFGKITKVNMYWNTRFRYDFRDEKEKTDAGLTFVTRPGKFYAFGVSNIGEHVSKSQVYERTNRLDAVIGATYGPFVGYAGAIRGTGGAGLVFHPFYWWNRKYMDRFNIETEMFDFGRDRDVKEDHVEGAVWNVGTQVAVNRWMRLGVRWEDLLERTAFMVYTNIIFRDQDLAALLGLASVAR